jgi:ribonuclease HII
VIIAGGLGKARAVLELVILGAMRFLGFDEAGRGSVLGPMVVGAYLLDEADAPRVREAGGRDSKGMSAARRAAAVPGLTELAVAYRTAVLDAPTIDVGNLNALEEEVFVRASAELRPDVVQIDAPVPPSGLERFRRRMAQALQLPLQRVQVANQAEDRFPSVGAASILAKVERDRQMALLREAHGELGSGYPSDPKTRAYLTSLLEDDEPLPPFVRSRWDTVRRIREEIEDRYRQRSLF